MNYPVALSCVYFLTDINGFNWLSAPFLEGNFKCMTVRYPKSASASSTPTDAPQVLVTPASSTALYSCPQEGCVRVFQRPSALERHLSVEACELSPERHSMMDLAKLKYASQLQEGAGLPPSVQVPTVDGSSSCYQPIKEGWTLKETKKAERFNANQKVLP